MFGNKYPYTDFHEINLDWILAEIMKLHHDYDEFKAVNTITNAGAWDITKQYQAWTIVSDNNAGYISLKPVPAGVSITNTDYWGLIADYDILITDLSNRISALEGQMSTLTGTTIPALQSNVSSLQTRVGRLENRKFIFIGDSYVNEGSYVTQLNSILGLTDGVDSFCNAQGGEGFTKGTGGNGYLDELQTHAGSMSDTVKESITDIFVVGGANDAEDNQIYGANTILTNATAFVNYARANFPHARIHFGFIGACRNDSSTLENRTQNNLELMRYFYRDTALSLGCSYINNIEYTTRWLPGLILKADGLHPNTTGGLVIAQGLAQYILTGEANIGVDHYPLTPSWINPIFSGIVNANLTMNNGVTTLHIDELAKIIATLTIEGGNRGVSPKTKIAEFAEVYANRAVYGYGNVYFSTDSRHTYQTVFELNGKLLSFCVVNGDNSGWHSITMTNGIMVVDACDLTFNTIDMA